MAPIFLIFSQNARICIFRVFFILPNFYRKNQRYNRKLICNPLLDSPNEIKPNWKWEKCYKITKMIHSSTNLPYQFWIRSTTSTNHRFCPRGSHFYPGHGEDGGRLLILPVFPGHYKVFINLFKVVLTGGVCWMSFVDMFACIEENLTSSCFIIP